MPSNPEKHPLYTTFDRLPCWNTVRTTSTRPRIQPTRRKEVDPLMSNTIVIARHRLVQQRNVLVRPIIGGHRPKASDLVMASTAPQRIGARFLYASSITRLLPRPHGVCSRFRLRVEDGDGHASRSRHQDHPSPGPVWRTLEVPPRDRRDSIVIEKSTTRTPPTRSTRLKALAVEFLAQWPFSHALLTEMVRRSCRGQPRTSSGAIVTNQVIYRPTTLRQADKPHQNMV